MREASGYDRIERSSGDTVDKADGGTEVNFARVVSVRTKRKQIFMYQRDDVKRRIIRSRREKTSEDVNSLGEIELIHMRSSLVKNGGVGNYQFAEVVEDQAGEDLLADELRFFRMKSRKANGIFEIPERSFNAPAKLVDRFEFIGREGS